MPKSKDDIGITLKKDCDSDAVLCGIDTERSNVRRYMRSLNNNKLFFHRSVLDISLAPKFLGGLTKLLENLPIDNENTTQNMTQPITSFST